MATRSASVLRIVAGLLGCLIVLAAQGPALAQSTLLPVNLRCEYLTDPLGLGETQPRLSWVSESGARRQVQTAYQILVAGDPRLLLRNTGDLWDSGQVTSDASIQIPYGGQPLKSQMRCYWKVRVWDKDGHPSRWSDPARWTMGLLDPNDWKAKWIGFDASRKRGAGATTLDLAQAQWIWSPEGTPAEAAPTGTRYFRKEFTLPEGHAFVWGACAVSADNSYKVTFNGRSIGSGSDYKHLTAADVRELLHAGKNVLAIEATNAGDTPNPAGLLVVLQLRSASGGRGIVVSNDTWQTSDTAEPGWTDAGFDANKWRPVQVLGPYGMAPWGELNVVSHELFLPPVQLLRKPFSVLKPVKRATVYASALGNYELRLNGRRIGDAYFTPGWTDYNTRVYYNAFDVTDLLNKRGSNVLGAMLADGWYSGYVGFSRIRDHYGKDTRFLAQLSIEYADGGAETIVTDGTWTASTGPILEGDFLMGETYDAQKEQPGWDSPGFDDSLWQPVNVTDSIIAKLEAYPGVPVREFREIKPVRMSDAGVRVADPAVPAAQSAYVYDMGTNFAGFVRLKVSGARAGDRITLRFAERLNPDGSIYTANLRGARATDTYICRGKGTEVWQPTFTYHGFQYVELTGYPGKPQLDTITGIELTSDTPVVGRFECSDDMANTLYRNICQTQRANFMDVPTDCPQRDERLGWMGDAQVYMRAATYNTDVAAFFTKWLADVRDAQGTNGAFSDVSPRKVATGDGTAAWGDAGVICPWTMYKVYGDTRVLDRQYDAMVKWIEYCRGTTTGLLRPAEGYGDWLSINADTPKDLLATAYFAYSTSLVARTAEVLGKNEDAQKYHQLFEDIKQAFDDAYVTEDARIKGETQTGYVLALAFDLLPTEKRGPAMEHLVDNIRDCNWHLSTGFIGTKDLMTTLTRFNAADAAYDLFHNDTFPSWGFSIRQGATSIWERWDGWAPDKGFQDPGMNSFAHYSFGAVAEWMFETIGGIDTEGSAYKHIIIRPKIDGRLTWARTSYNSIYGPITTGWQVSPRGTPVAQPPRARPTTSAPVRRTPPMRPGPSRPYAGAALVLDVTIPPNTTATLYIPAKDPSVVKESGRLAADAPGLSFVTQQGDEAVFNAASGHYRFRSQLP
jgi:alpha-L-rhamnosidase